MKKVATVLFLILSINAQQNDILKSKYGYSEFDDHIFDNNRTEKPVTKIPTLLKSSIVNTNPEFISATSDSVYEDSTYLFNVLTNDPDGNSVTVSVASNPSWLSLTAKPGGTISDITSYWLDDLPTSGATAVETYISSPADIVFDSDGNQYVSGHINNVIYKIDTNGNISAFAGTGASGYSGDGGAATSATINTPAGLEFDSNGNLYFADASNHCIRKIDTSGNISTFAGTGGESGFSGDGGAATSAKLNFPYRVTFDSNGNLYIADLSNHVIRKVDTNGNISTFAGTGTGDYSGDGGAATSATLNNPTGVAFDSNGNLYISSQNNDVIRKVDTNGNISTFAGTGTEGYSGDGGAATSATLYNPWGVTVDASGNVYIADSENHRIRKVDTNGNISTFAGTGTEGYSGDGGAATSATLNSSEMIRIHNNNAYIADYGNNRVRKIDDNGIITTIAGTDIYKGENIPASSARMNYPYHIDLDNIGNVYIADWDNYRVRKIDTNGMITTVAGNGTKGYSGDSGVATSAQIDSPMDVAVDNNGNLYITDYYNHRIRKVDSNGLITTYAGTGEDGYSGDGGQATSAKIKKPRGVAVDADGNLFFSSYNHIIRKVDTDGIITTFAGTGESGFSGDGGAATSAQFNVPNGIDLDASGNLYISERNNYRIRKVDTSGNISTIAGTGTSGYSGDGGLAISANISQPYGLSVDGSGNVYFCDTYNHVVRKILTNGNIITIAGTGTSGYDSGISDAASTKLNYPVGIALDSLENIYFSDNTNSLIRKIDASYHTLTGTPTNSAVGNHTMTLTASDGQGGSATQSFALKVINTNDAPVLASVTNVTTNEDTAKTVTLSATDVDGDALTYTGKSNTDKVTISISSATMTLSPAADWYGTASITAYVSDGTVKDSTSFSLTVASISDVAAINTTTIEEDASATVTLSSTFSGTPTYSAKSDTSAITVSVSSTTLQLTPSSNWNGTSTITAYASVGTFKDSTTFTLSVTAVNDAPTMTFFTPKTSLNLDGTDDYVDLGVISSTNFTNADFSIQTWVKTTSSKAQSILVKGDGNGAWEAGEKALYMETAGYPWFVGYDNEYIPGTGLTINDGLWHHIVVTWDYSEGETGSAAIYVDGVKATVETSYRARTVDKSTDKLYLGKAEAYAAQNYFDGNIDEVGIWDKALSDVEVAALYNSSSGLNAAINSGNYTSSSNLQGYWRMYEGTGNIINDLSTNNNSGTISGATWDTNTGIGSTNVVTNEETATKIALSASDIDGDALTYTASADTNAVTLTVLTDSLQLTPALNYTGTSVITVIVSDNVLTDTTKFDFKVINVNDAPVITAVANDTTSEDSDGKVLKLSASDVEGDALTYSGIADTSAITVTSSNDTLKLIPQANWNGSSMITAIVSDGIASDSTTFTLTVTSVNDAPSLLDTTFNEDTSISIVYTMQSGVTLGAKADTSAIKFSMSNNNLSITPDADYFGSSTVTLTAYEGALALDSTFFTVSVKQIQDAPYAFDWVSTASDSINITESNLADTYELKWSESKDVDGETIDYLLYVKIGVLQPEEIYDTTSTSVPITYQEFLDNVFEPFPMLPRVSVQFTMEATDGIDTVKITGDNRVLFVNRYEFLSTEGEGIPTEFALHENYPNPFNPTTTLRFDLPQVSDLTLTIYNMLGQKVRTFNYQNTSAGYHSVTWDATNDLGQQVGAGVYLYQLQTKDFVKTRKMVLLK